MLEFTLGTLFGSDGCLAASRPFVGHDIHDQTGIIYGDIFGVYAVGGEHVDLPIAAKLGIAMIAGILLQKPFCRALRDKYGTLAIPGVVGRKHLVLDVPLRSTGQQRGRYTVEKLDWPTCVRSR